MKYCIALLTVLTVAASGTAWGQASATNSLGTVKFSLSVASTNPIATIYTDGNVSAGTETASHNNGTEEGYVGPYTYTFASSGMSLKTTPAAHLLARLTRLSMAPQKVSSTGSASTFCKTSIRPAIQRMCIRWDPQRHRRTPMPCRASPEARRTLTTS